MSKLRQLLTLKKDSLKKGFQITPFWCCTFPINKIWIFEKFNVHFQFGFCRISLVNLSCLRQQYILTPCSDNIIHHLSWISRVYTRLVLTTHYLNTKYAKLPKKFPQSVFIQIKWGCSHILVVVLRLRYESSRKSVMKSWLHLLAVVVFSNC